MTDKKCKDLVSADWEDRKKDFEILLEAEDNQTEELGSLGDYGVGFELVKAGTFKGQRENYFRYQLSWGGPSEEIRIYENGDIEFWYLDWFDGACIDITEDDVAIKLIDWLFCGYEIPEYFELARSKNDRY